jgi:CBS domain-containing protein
MKLANLCKRPAVTIDNDATLQQAAQVMREQHVGALVVIEHGDDGPHVAGVLTDRDLALEVLTRGVDAAQVAVSRLRGAPLVTAPQSADLAQAVGLMQAAGVRQLLVRNEAGHLVGVVSFDDLLQACVAPLAGLAEVLRKGLERDSTRRAALAQPSGPPVRVPAAGTAGWTRR